MFNNHSEINHHRRSRWTTFSTSSCSNRPSFWSIGKLLETSRYYPILLLNSLHFPEYFLTLPDKTSQWGRLSESGHTHKRESQNNSLKPLNIAEWWYLTGSEYPGVKFFKWSRLCVCLQMTEGRVILSARPKYGHFEDRTQRARSAPLTQWVIPIYFPRYLSYSLFSLFHNFVLSSAILLNALHTNSSFLACLHSALPRSIQIILNT